MKRLLLVIGCALALATPAAATAPPVTEDPGSGGCGSWHLVTECHANWPDWWNTTCTQYMEDACGHRI